MDSLSESVALVTGASRGFGREISLALALEGVQVVAAALASEKEELISLVEEIRSAGGKAAWRPVDVRVSDECSSLVGWTVKEMGGLHVLVNCAGLGYWGPVEDMTDDKWQRTMDVNVSGTFYLSRAAIGPMRKEGRGHIVNIASVMGRRGVPNMTAYCASKAAVMAFSEGLSKEVKGDGIQVSVLSPGTANTRFREKHTSRPLDPSITDPELMLQPADVASAVLWALKSSRYVSALQIVVEPRG